MKIVLMTMGKTTYPFLKDGISYYNSRLKHYNNFEIIEIKNLKKTKNLSQSELLKKEGDVILDHIDASDYLILLDEKGKSFSSLMLSRKLQEWMFLSKKRLVFLIGGAYGCSKAIYDRSNEVLSFSKMTFSHQMIRLFFVEQLYRSYTILNNEPYHHE